MLPHCHCAFLVGGGHGEAPTKDNQDPIDLYTQSLNSNIKLQDLLALHSEQWEMKSGKLMRVVGCRKGREGKGFQAQGHAHTRAWLCGKAWQVERRVVTWNGSLILYIFVEGSEGYKGA